MATQPVPIKVLVVDDNEKARDALIELLRFDDVQVVGESTLGAAAYTWAEHLNVDLVLVAVGEPLARALRTVEALTVGARTWPVVAHSPLGDRETMRKAMLAGVRDYVVTPASGEELRGAIVLLIFGAIDTTQNQIGLAMATFLDHTDQWALLAEQPDLGRQAIDEVMRVAPTTTWTTREAAEDFEFQGVEIPKGTTVHLMSAAASTDPAVYDPDRFDITVERERGVGFGGGIHHCLGHFVARTDMAEALPLLAQRMPNPRLDGEPVWLPLTGNTGPVALPIAFG
jgi:cytochrome P450